MEHDGNVTWTSHAACGATKDKCEAQHLAKGVKDPEVSLAKLQQSSLMLETTLSRVLQHSGERQGTPPGSAAWSRPQSWGAGPSIE